VAKKSQMSLFCPDYVTLRLEFVALRHEKFLCYTFAHE
jgi:hypothetical protein